MSLNSFLRREAYHRSRPAHTALDLVFSSAVIYAVVGVLSNFVSFWHGGGPLIITSLSWKLSGALAVVLGAAPLLLNRIKPDTDLRPPQLHIMPFVAALALLIFTDFPEHRMAFRVPRTVFAGAGAAGLLILLFVRRRGERQSNFARLAIPALIALELALGWVFLHEAHGRLIWSDDHPSFLYRLILLRDHFPHLPFYNTDWNAGYSAREVYPTGSLNLYLLGYPFVHWVGDFAQWQDAAGYNVLVVYVMLFVVPWSIFVAGRAFELTRTESTLAAFLALGPTMSLFEFGLKYGTLPFVISSALLVPLLGLIAGLAFNEKSPRFVLVAFTTLVGFLCAAWHLILLGLLPICGLLLTHLPHLRRAGRLRALFLCGTWILILSGPSLITIARESGLLQLTARSTLPGSSSELSTVRAAEKKRLEQEEAQTAAQPEPLSLQASRQALAWLAAKTNPLLLILCVPALFSVPRSPKRTVLGATVIWLLCVSVLGQHFKPQFELHRFFLPACFLLTLPVARLVSQLLHSSVQSIGADTLSLGRTTLSALFATFTLAGVCLSMPAQLVSVYSNHSNERFRFAPNETPGFVNALREHGGKGRTFFTGFILHDFGATDYKAQDGGHVAPLAAFSGQPLYASSYYHIVWSTVDPIPRAYLDRDDAGIEEFLDLVNATSVVTFKREWTTYCAAKERYHEVWHQGRFHLFTRRTDTPSYFLEGSGEVRALEDGFEVTPASDVTVLKFRYFEKLRTSKPESAQLEPVPVFIEDLGGGKEQQVSFIRLKVAPEIVAKRQPIRIGYFAE